MSKTQALRASYEKTIKATADEDGNPQHFYDRIIRERQKDPTAFDKRYDDAVATGKQNAADFLRSVRDFHQPQHAAAIKKYQDAYEANPVKVDDDMVKAAIKTSGAKAYEFRNLGYEQGLFKNMAVETPDELATLNSLRDLFQKKHCAVGYDGDKAVLDTFNAENLPLRGTVNKNIRE